MSLYREFKAFALKGNVVDVAIGVIIGMVFGNLIDSLIKDIIMPLLGFFIGGVDFSNLSLELHFPGSETPPVAVRYGVFLNALLNFFVVSGAVFFVVQCMNRLLHTDFGTSHLMKNCEECKMKIPAGAKKCGFCCSQVEKNITEVSSL